MDHWRAVDDYLSSALLPEDPLLGATLADARAAGLPAIDVAPNQGMLLHILARSVRAERILEVGTLGGYSTIWLARALPAGGRLVTLEIEQRHAAVARTNLERAGLADRVEVRVAPAAASLAALVEEGAGPFDLVFIDADKPGNPEYLSWALRLTRAGSLVVVDNVVRDGAVADAASDDAGVVGSRRCLEAMGADPRLAATAIQTVGVKGYDGFAVGLVLDSR
jgi:predicted O-methyltransferase YrrM